MIKTVSEMLQAFIREETEKLDSYQIKHGPTIGDMYEGLSAELLNRAIPDQLNLRVVSGFITDGGQHLSGQMDCMLVQGEGEAIPYTENTYKWHVRDVIAVLEIKKTLYSKDLIDSFLKLRQVSESYSKYLFDGDHSDNRKIDLSSSYKIFSQLTGIHAPSYHQRHELTKENELIYTTVFMEQLTPLRIVLGYHGFSTEHSLRQGLVKFLEEQGVGPGFGVPAFPQLIISGHNSLVKANGRPYLSTMRDGYWDFMCSSRANPIIFILELIWSKIELEFDVSMPWGDDLEVEVLNEFLRAKPFFGKDQAGWHLVYDELSSKTLESRCDSKSWEPLEVTSSQYVIFNRLANENIDTSDPDFIEFAEKESGSAEDFVKSITSSGHAALDGLELKLTTENLVALISPDGRFLIAENNSGRLAPWLNSNFDKKM
ncbi:DUF6602 domain-containing protein [Marinimicrobium sp. ABcell2]|uniref:DUF6602 domain-containing protein n=1 Tax=Marinimicrobium sp. ABcell2 TaxID=3069751 RepID=UPI0027B175E5|nr:DUF6602 domain-containing protein [Marinimicrobium sp. ABcell2]MDQ2076929.1 hypothetical protein [Marinimicrobium sp. ABcell2]